MSLSFFSAYTRYNPPSVYPDEVLTGADRQRLDEYDAVMDALELVEPGTYKTVKEYHFKMQMIKKIDEIIEKLDACGDE